MPRTYTQHLPSNWLWAAAAALMAMAGCRRQCAEVLRRYLPRYRQRLVMKRYTSLLYTIYTFRNLFQFSAFQHNLWSFEDCYGEDTNLRCLNFSINLFFPLPFPLSRTLSLAFSTPFCFAWFSFLQFGPCFAMFAQQKCSDLNLIQFAVDIWTWTWTEALTRSMTVCLGTCVDPLALFLPWARI